MKMIDGQMKVAPPVRREGKVEVKLKSSAPKGAKL
jgi:hypothetical protein